VEGGGGGAAGGAGAGGIGKDTKGGKESEAMSDVVKVFLVVDVDGIVGADGV
jgi:hypothetical protein